MRVDLFLAGIKGREVLKSLCAGPAREIISSVTAARDKQVENDYYNDIRAIAEVNKLLFYDESAVPSGLNYKLAIGWRRMLDTDKTIVIHDSLLPRYRGFAPLVTALINGDTELGATAIYASTHYDAGPVIAQQKMSITHPMRIQYAIDKMASLYALLANDIFETIRAGRQPLAIAQDETQASYSLWRDELDYEIDWSQSSGRIQRTIYALSFPYKGATTLLNGQRIIVHDAQMVPDVAIENRQPGKVIFMEDGLPIVVCGEGLIKITAATDQDHHSVLPLAKFRSRFGR